MKKLLVFFVIISLLATFAACGSNEDAHSADGSSSTDSSITAEASDDEIAEGSSVETPEIQPVESSAIIIEVTEAPESKDPVISDVSMDYGTSVSDTEVLSDKAYTVYIVDNGDGTYTVKALIPEKVGSGKIVVSASQSLSLVSGSLSTAIEGGLINEKYDRGGVKGACVVFASSATFPKGTVAFTATYKAKDGAVISEKDISIFEWNLTSGTGYLGTHRDSTVVIRYVTK